MAANLTYETDVALAVTALSTSLADGEWWGSAEIDVEDDSLNIIDHILGGNFVMGTSPTAGNTIDVYVAARWGDGVNDYQGSIGNGLPAGDAEVTPGTGIVEENLTLACSVICVSNTGYNVKWSCGSVANLFGGILPPAYCVVVENNSNVNLGSGSDITYTPVGLTDV